MLLTRLVPWALEDGATTGSPLDADDRSGSYTVDMSVEGPWAPRRPAGEPPVVQIVDGVQRTEAHALTDTLLGEVVPALFGAYAVGAVRCEPGVARIMDGDAGPQCERLYLQAALAGGDVEVDAGSAQLRYRAMAVPDAVEPRDLDHALSKEMLAAEARLADILSRDTGVLTLVDGPLQRPLTGWRVAGYIKRTVKWYLGAAERKIFDDLAVGDRTPLFRIIGRDADGVTAGRTRLSWYVRIADLGPHMHPMGSVMRLEASAGLSLDQAIGLADECALVLPRLASSPMRDPRAPHNLTPVGGLEAILRRRLGDRDWVYRRLLLTLSGAERTAGPAGAEMRGAS